VHHAAPGQASLCAGAHPSCASVCMRSGADGECRLQQVLLQTEGLGIVELLEKLGWHEQASAQLQAAACRTDV
jgi:hypothetical protein